jgi:hypothetical protein
MTNRQRRGAGESAPNVPDFEPVKLRYRHDGLTPARQVAVVQAMAACGCIREACAKVGISPEAVYELRRRPDAQSFRLAMDLALDGAVDRIEDAVFARAIEGVEVPHYYKGELVGTHRRYDERLALFLLRYRKPYRYGKHVDRRDRAPHPERSALGMANSLTWVAADAQREVLGRRRQVMTELAQDGDEEPWNTDYLYRWGPACAAPPEEEEELDEEDDFELGAEGVPPDVSSATSTSGRTPNRRMRRRAAAKGRKR